jgi:hypothetical protein
MSSVFNLIVDTTAPQTPTLALNGNAATTAVRDITAQLATVDTPTTNYQIKIWGDVDPASNAAIQTTEGASSWITPGSFPANQAVRLAAGDGSKTINARIRDDVWNETAVLTKSISLDTSAPVADWTAGPDTPKVSTVSGKRVVNATFTVGAEPITAWEVRVAPNSGSDRASSALIGTTNGSTGVSGGAKAAAATQAVAIDGRDILAASPGEGAKVIKLFVQDALGNWSSA